MITAYCLPWANWCPASLLTMATMENSVPQFYCWAWCHMAWNISLTSWGQLSWLSPFPASFLLTRMAEWETENVLTLCNQCSTKAKTLMYDQPYFFSLVWNTELYGLMWGRKHSSVVARSSGKKKKKKRKNKKRKKKDTLRGIL